MVNIPVRFQRVAAAFDEMAKVCSCESSGSEHSADLSVLVNSFFEREISDRKIRANDEDVLDRDFSDADEVNDGEIEVISPDQIESTESLKRFFDLGNDAVKRSIHAEVEAALGEVSGEKDSLPEFKRQLMARLRSRGFDAGLCKSKWEKNGHNPSGNYEYIDVNTGDNSRYMVEVNLAGEFTIARPTVSYTSLLENFPAIFVGKPEELKQVIRLMSKAIRKSMKSVKLNMPPWRRLAYMQAKWLGSYKRTINETPTRKACESLSGSRFVGFAPAMGKTTSLYCRGDFVAQRGGGRIISNLAAALK
ncbi:hypothetical protein CASFOL_028770 [Castilleja foliolosa]|uniref:DUF506 family protein n=1 Tax=Castilleja foliolosa TaxID=1961234 RepID=A0ABD3CFE8_9LAMI